MTIESAYIPFNTGEDTASPPGTRNPGSLLLSQNYECDTSGSLRRIDGYEIFDGRVSPSDATYYVWLFDTGSTEIEVDDTLTGATSGATGVVTAVDLSSGSWVGGDAAGRVAITKKVGNYTLGEDLQVSASKVAEAGAALGQELFFGNEEFTLHQIAMRNARDAYRGDIGQPTGSGEIRGGFYFNDVCYAFRNVSGNASKAMWKSTSSGWTQVDLGRVLDFDAGTAEFVVGETLTGGTSAATGVIRGVVVQSGTFGAGTADGYIVLSGVTGAFQNNETVTSASGSATADGVDAAIVLQPNGKVRHVIYNFGGIDETRKVYFVDGENLAMEFDGTYVVPIRTGATNDTPDHVAAHVSRLFLTFQGGSLQYSAVNDPFSWTLLTGANEIGLGDTCTGMLVLQGNALGVWTRNSTRILYGTSNSDFQLAMFSQESGAIEDSIQKMGAPKFLDDRGATSMQAVDAFGDFKTGTYSQPVDRFLRAFKSGFSCSIVSRERSIYRLFFDSAVFFPGGSTVQEVSVGLSFTFNGEKLVGVTRTAYAHRFVCAWMGETSAGEEVLFAGDLAGRVFQMDKGVSLNGDPVWAFFITQRHAYRSPNREKRFRRVELELEAESGTVIQTQPEYGYVNLQIPSGSTQTDTVTDLAYDQGAVPVLWTSGTTIQVSGVQEFGSLTFGIDGIGKHMAMIVNTNYDVEKPHIISGMTVDYSPRRRAR